MAEILYTYRFVFVVALLGAAAALLTDRNKLPLALRGLHKMMKKEAGPSVPAAGTKPWKKILAFGLVLAAFVIAVM